MDAFDNDMIIPFGKYKGESIMKLYEDTKYLKWCQDQPWFKEKYANIYNVVVNQTIIKSNLGDKTPEHNKIQNLFLDKDQCIKLISKFTDVNKFIKHNNGEYKYQSNTYTICTDCRPCSIHRKPDYYKYHKYQNIPSKEHAEISSCVDCTQCEDCVDTKFTHNLDLEIEFEGDYNWDIIIKYLQDRQLLIELKPSLGDDYPNVLRKMKLQYKLSKKPHGYHSDRLKCILLLNTFDSVNTTKDNLKEIFAQSNISVIFLDELNINLSNFLSLEEENKILKNYLSSINIDYKNLLK